MNRNMRNTAMPDKNHWAYCARHMHGFKRLPWSQRLIPNVFKADVELDLTGTRSVDDARVSNNNNDEHNYFWVDGSIRICGSTSSEWTQSIQFRKTSENGSNETWQADFRVSSDFSTRRGNVRKMHWFWTMSERKMEHQLEKLKRMQTNLILD